MLEVTPADVAARLGRSLTETETARTDGLLLEAGLLVEAYLGRAVDSADPQADRFKVVVSRIVARALTAPEATQGAEQLSETLGAYSSSVRFTEGSRDGGVWLSASDKLMLSGMGGARSSMVSVELVSERTP